MIAIYAILRLYIQIHPDTRSPNVEMEAMMNLVSTPWFTGFFKFFQGRHHPPPHCARAAWGPGIADPAVLVLVSVLRRFSPWKRPHDSECFQLVPTRIPRYLLRCARCRPHFRMNSGVFSNRPNASNDDEHDDVNLRRGPLSRMPMDEHPHDIHVWYTCNVG